MAISRLSALSATLRAAGTPFTGLADNTPNGQPLAAAHITINFTAGATQEQRDAAHAIRDGFDYRPRRDLSDAQIASQIASLTTAQEVVLRRRSLARVLLSNPDAAHEIIATLGLPVAVDEVIP